MNNKIVSIILYQNNYSYYAEVERTNENDDTFHSTYILSKHGINRITRLMGLYDFHIIDDYIQIINPYNAL